MGDRERSSGPHIIAILPAEGDCPNAFDIRCSCNFYENTLWGEEHAKELAREHKKAVGALPILIPLF